MVVNNERLSEYVVVNMIIINGASIMESGACLVVGLNSGTSMDGIDACIVEFTEDPADAVPAPRYGGCTLVIPG